MSIELSKCPCGGAVKISGGTKRFGWCYICGMSGPDKTTEDEAALAWNEMCEQIRVGKAVFEAIPEGWELVRVGRGLLEKEWFLCGEGITQSAINRPSAFVAVIQKVPAPVLDPLDVLRESGSYLATLGTRVIHRRDINPILDRINTVLQQASDKEYDHA